MILSLSTEAMLSRWRLLRGYEPLRSDHAASRRDGIDLDSLLLDEIRAWYARLLDEAPISMLAITDIASAITIEPCGDGSAIATLPDNCRRLLSITLEGWERPAVPIYEADSSAAKLLQRQTNPFSQSRSTAPVAFILPDRKVSLYSIPDGISSPTVTAASAVTEPADGTFVFDSSALDTIPKYVFNPLQ